MKPWVPSPAQGWGGAFQPQALWELKVTTQTWSSARTTLNRTSPQNVTKKPLYNTYELLWWRTQVPEKHTFCPEAQEGPEENASKPCEGTECQEEANRAPGKPKEAQLQTPKSPNHRIHQLAVITMLWKKICGYMAKGRKAQTKAKAAASSALVPKGAQPPEKAP